MKKRGGPKRETEDHASRPAAVDGGAAREHARGVGDGNALELDQPADRASGAGNVGGTAAEDPADLCLQTEERSQGCGETGAHGAAGAELHGTDPAPQCGAAGGPGGRDEGGGAVAVPGQPGRGAVPGIGAGPG